MMHRLPRLVFSTNFWASQTFQEKKTSRRGLFVDLTSTIFVPPDLRYVVWCLAIGLTGSAADRFVTYWVPIQNFTLPIRRVQYYGKQMENLSAAFISYDILPLLPSVYSHYETPSAYPSLRDAGQGHSFIQVFLGWEDESDDEAIRKIGAESAAYMRRFAVNEGQGVAHALLYPNAAPPGTDVLDMYGDALGRLHSIKRAVDPGNLMGRAGGWKF
ncbi:hypothetical protein BDR04DRAFT_1093745 [Suillus decipiens]|nr:hypothetical protein BDR04DRAFT_1093745 [Suillus decipiens]